MNFIKWNMEERLVTIFVTWEMNLLFRQGGTWGCFVVRDRRRYMAFTQTKPNKSKPGSGLIRTHSSCLAGSTSWSSGRALGGAAPESSLPCSFSLKSLHFDKKANDRISVKI